MGVYLSRASPPRVARRTSFGDQLPQVLESEALLDNPRTHENRSSFALVHEDAQDEAMSGFVAMLDTAPEAILDQGDGPAPNRRRQSLSLVDRSPVIPFKAEEEACAPNRRTSQDGPPVSWPMGAGAVQLGSCCSPPAPRRGSSLEAGHAVQPTPLEDDDAVHSGRASPPPDRGSRRSPLAARPTETSPHPRRSSARRSPPPARLSEASPQAGRASQAGGTSTMATSMSNYTRKSLRRPSVSRAEEMSEEVAELLRKGIANGFTAATVATYSCRGIEDGKPKTNQDCACVAHPLSKQPGTALFCVFDGHGTHGDHASQEVLHSIHYVLEAGYKRLLKVPDRALSEAFEAVNAHLLKVYVEQQRRLSSTQKGRGESLLNVGGSGCCATVVFMRGRKLWIGNAGDCRAVIGTSEPEVGTVAVQLTRDHKVDQPDEQARIERCGGHVLPSDDDLPAKLYYRADQLQNGPGLAISRCLGDLDSLCIGVSPTPEVTSHEVEASDLFLILASDGVWEFIQSEEAVAIVGRFHSAGKSAEEACRYLIAKAAVSWRHHEGDYRDDITALVIYLQPVTSLLEAELRLFGEGAVAASPASPPPVHKSSPLGARLAADGCQPAAVTLRPPAANPYKSPLGSGNGSPAFLRPVEARLTAMAPVADFTGY